MSCWKSIGSPSVVPLPTLLTAFDGHSHKLHGIILVFPISVGGKVVNVEIEVIDANLDYNLLLGRKWVYEIDVVVSTLFHVICFPHKGKIVKVDQLDYCLVDPQATSDSTIPLVDNPRPPIDNLGVGMYSSLMDDHSTPSSEEEFEGYVAPTWAFDSTSALDCLDTVLPSEEAILEVMMGVYRPWEDLHHRSYFLPPLQEVEARFFKLFTSDVGKISNPLALAHFCAKDVFSWSYEEIPNIEPSIVQHEIKTYENAKLVRQRLRLVNPRKSTTFKAEVEKLLKAGFIYPIPLTNWVSNPVLVDKKQGTI
eukprot:PITA_27995